MMQVTIYLTDPPCITPQKWHVNKILIFFQMSQETVNRKVWILGPHRSSGGIIPPSNSKIQSRPRFHILANPRRKIPSPPASRKAIFCQSGGAVKNLIAKTSLAYAKIPRPLRCNPRRRVQLTPQPLNAAEC
jgi:hypothetical protein